MKFFQYTMHTPAENFKKVKGAEKARKQAGFLELLVIIIIALVLLNVLGIDIKSVLAKPWVKDFITYMITLLKIVWQDILEIVAFIKDLVA